jgi:enoyl-CoA hydratase/carnithine racemase
MYLKFEHDSILELRFDRPPANALSIELLKALRVEVESAVQNEVEALVLSGSEGMFSAGLDVPQLIDLDRGGIFDLWSSLYGLMQALATSPVPVAAAITGHSPAGGAVLSLMCDRRIMAAGRYRIGLNEVQVGVSMPPSVYQVMRILVGDRLTERLCVEAKLLLADEALEVGLVDEVVAVDRVVPRALEWIVGLRSLPRGVMLETRGLVRTPIRAILENTDPEEINLLVENWFREETQQALRALVDRLGSPK